MSFPPRRVVTGHDENGNAVVKIDEVTDNVISRRENHRSAVLWTTGSVPADNSGDEDAALGQVDRAVAGGTVFRVVEYGPGVAPARHQTDSVDYAVVLSGQIEMELDGDEVVTLRQGDVLVQRGTVHNWVNNGSEPCVIAFALVGAEPLR